MTQIIKIRSEKGDITTDATDIKIILRLVQMIYANKLNNLEKNKFLETYSLLSTS